MESILSHMPPDLFICAVKTKINSVPPENWFKLRIPIFHYQSNPKHILSKDNVYINNAHFHHFSLSFLNMDSSSPTYQTGDVAWILTSTALVWLMIPGVGYFYSGMARQKNALSLIMACVLSLVVVSVEVTKNASLNE